MIFILVIYIFYTFFFFSFFFNDTATTEIYTLSLHDALPICCQSSSDTRPLRWIVFWRNLPASFATKLPACEDAASSIILKPSHSPLLPGCARLALIRGASSMKLSEVAQKLACRLEGAPDTEIRGIAGIEHAEPGQITFLANRRYFPLL